MDETLMNEVAAALLRKDSRLAEQVLRELLEDGKQRELLLALREMTDAFGGVPTLAKQAGLSPSQFDREFLTNGIPLICSLSAILKAMGMQLRIRGLR